MKHLLGLTLLCLFVLASTGCQDVTSENHPLGTGQTLSGDLVVLGWDSILAQGSHVTGSLFMTGGTVKTNGSIDGDVSLGGADITLGPNAVVRGSVHRTGGRLDVAQGASMPSVPINRSQANRDPGHTVANVVTLGFMLLLVFISAAVPLMLIGLVLWFDQIFKHLTPTV